jgi:hypothetical protein
MDRKKKDRKKDRTVQKKEPIDIPAEGTTSIAMIPFEFRI